jgi:hypothetical protein
MAGWTPGNDTDAGVGCSQAPAVLDRNDLRVLAPRDRPITRQLA